MTDEPQRQPQPNQNRSQQPHPSTPSGGEERGFVPPPPPPPPPRQETPKPTERPSQIRPQPNVSAKEEPHESRPEPSSAGLQQASAPAPRDIPTEPVFPRSHRPPAPKPEQPLSGRQPDQVRPEPIRATQQQPLGRPQETPAPAPQPISKPVPSPAIDRLEPAERSSAPKPPQPAIRPVFSSSSPIRESSPLGEEQFGQEQNRQPARQQSAPFDPSQKKALLSRGEVHTMNKDISKLREQEAKKEQERISQLKSQQEIEQEREAVQRIRQTAQATKKQEEVSRREQLRRIQNSILPPGEEQRVQTLPKRPSPNRKVFVRVIFVIIFAFVALNLLLFAYWFFFQRESAQLPFLSPGQEEQQTPQPPPTGEPTPSPEPTPAPTSPAPTSESLTSLVNPSHTTTLQFSSGENLDSLLSQLLEESQSAGFTHLLLRSKPENMQLSSAHAFFSLFGVSVPEQVVPHVSQNALFFAHTTENGNRFGMVMPVQNPQEAMQAFGQWETHMEEDFSPLLGFWGQPGTGHTGSFRPATHQGTEVRLQTFSTQDYGIVYGALNNYLIVASSLETTKAVIETLQASLSAQLQPTVLASLSDPNGFKPPPVLSADQAIGQTLLVGFEGSTLTPELEDFMRRLQPGGVLLLSRNLKNASQLKQLTEDLQRISLEYSQIPLFIAVDQEGDPISRIAFAKEKTAQSDIVDDSHAYSIGQERGHELRSLGVNLNLSPVLDDTQPSDFLFDRTFQTEEERAGKLASSFVRGQKDAGILSTLKHFPGYGSIPFNPEKSLATVQELPNFSSFRSAFAAQPEFVLTSNAIYTELDAGVPFTFSSKGISLIRSELGFSGIILSDDLSQPSLLNTYSLDTITTAPLRAGVTMIMFSEGLYAKKAQEVLKNLMQTDAQLEQNIRGSAAKIIEVKKEFFRAAPPASLLEHLSQNK